MTKTLRIGAENMANRSGDSLAILFGDTSPNIRTTIVVTTVETLAPASSPRKRTKMSVDREAQAMFTMLLPIRIVESIPS